MECVVLLDSMMILVCLVLFITSEILGWIGGDVRAVSQWYRLFLPPTPSPPPSPLFTPTYASTSSSTITTTSSSESEVTLQWSE